MYKDGCHFSNIWEEIVLTWSVAHILVFCRRVKKVEWWKPSPCIVNKSDSVCSLCVYCLFFTLCFANFKMHSKPALCTMFNKLSRILFPFPFSLDICQKFCINVITSMYGFDFGVVACADAMDPPPTNPQCEPIHVLPLPDYGTHTTCTKIWLLVPSTLPGYGAHATQQPHLSKAKRG